MHHRVLARLWTLSSLLQIPLVACSPPGALSILVAMHDPPPPHLSVWLISRAIHMEMAAIHRGNPGRATRSLPSLLPNQSLLLLPYFKVLYCLIASPSFFFQSSSGSISPSGWKPPRTCQFLKPFGCILCVCFWVLALWGWSRGHRVIFELTGNVGGMHHHRPCLHSGCNCLSRT